MISLVDLPLRKIVLRSTFYGVYNYRKCLFCVVFQLFWFIVLFLPSVLEAQTETYPRVVSKQVYLDLLDNDRRYSWQELFDLSLEASGVAAKDFDVYRDKMTIYVHDLQKLLAPLASDYDKGEAILQYMYGFLADYQALQTKMDVMFDTGNYNCVTSAILYTILARALGFNATGVGTYDHAFVNFALSDGRHIDAETTTKFGFDPGKKKEFIDTFTSTTGLLYVPKKNYRKRDDLRDPEFISLILQNRLYILNQNTHSFLVLEQMIPLASDLATLTQSEKDIQNFFSMASQYSFNLAENGQVKRSLAFTDSILNTYGKRESILEVRDRIAYNDVIRSLQKKQYEGANVKLKLYREQNVIKQENEQKLATVLQKHEIEGIVNSAKVSFEQKLSAVKKIENNNVVSAKELRELYEVVYGNELNDLIREQKFSQAPTVLETYPEKLKNSNFYRKMARTVEHNFVVSVYKRFVSQVGRGAYREAEVTLSQGLQIYPGNFKLKELKAQLQQLSNRLGDIE